MFKLTLKKEIAIRIICLITLLTLCFLVYLNGKDLDCDNCVVNFEARRRGFETASNLPFQNFSVKLIDMYNNLSEGYCLVEFDKMQGYYLRGDIGFKLNVTEIK